MHRRTHVQCSLLLCVAVAGIEYTLPATKDKFVISFSEARLLSGQWAKSTVRVYTRTALYRITMNIEQVY